MSAAAPRVRLTLKGALKLVLSGLILALVLSFVGGGTVLDALARARPGPWLVALGGFLGLHALSALKWRFFLGLAGARIAPLPATRMYGAGLFANLCLPSLIGGDVLRAGLAMRASGASEAVLLGSVLDRGFDLLGLGLLVALGMTLAPGAAAEAGYGTVSGMVVLVGLGVAAALGLIGLRFAAQVIPLRRLPRKARRLAVRALRAGRRIARVPGKAAVGLAACVGLQVGFVLVNVPLGRMLGLEMDLRLWLLLWPLAKVAAMLPLSLGGLGVREAAFAALAAPFVAPELAVATSLAWQSVLIVGGLVAGGWWMLAPAPSPRAPAGPVRG